ncbi:3-isopropylmalate dehydratase small subunit [Pigmentiphaga soli]|uniref:3-isopropylmalate dehydratase small subunit n=1 Tax=Pigmentiphaga soli TaxID=1007095 RepID=A0ABP8GRD4_9BURK
MSPFTRITAVAAPLDMDNVDTDKLIPSRFFKKARGDGLQQYLLHDLRFDGDGRERADFVLNQAPYRAAKILVAGANFGCGSGREAAVYAVLDYGFSAVVAPSFGELYYGNMLQNGMLPVVLPEAACADLRRLLRERPGSCLEIDLETRSLTGPDGRRHVFDLAETARQRLLQGLDDIALILQHLPEIEAYESRMRADMPWRHRPPAGVS